MQQLLPDIKALYQRKYLQAASLAPEHPINDTRDFVLHRARRFQERTGPMHPPIKPACIRILKNQSSPRTARLPSRGETASAGSENLARGPRQEKNSQSTCSFRAKQELTQLLQVSQQQLAELQSSIGGEKTLMGLLNVFFQRRHQRQQASRALRASSEFKPMKNLLARRYQEEKSRQFRVKKERGGREEGKPREKDLAPWSVQDIEPM